MPTWSVARLDPASEPVYAALVAGAAAAPLSQSLLWRDALCRLGLGEPVYWLASRGGHARAALPAFVRRSSLGAVLNSLPFVQSTGGVITARDAGRAERAEAVAVLVESMLAHCRADAIDVAVLVGAPYPSDADDEADFPRPPDFRMVRTTSALDLRLPFEPRTSVLGAIRKAEAARLTHRVARTQAEARAVYDLYASSMPRVGAVAHPWLLFEQLWERGGARLVWAEAQGQPVAALILLVHGEVVDYYCVGTSELGRRLQAASWLSMRELEHARSAGGRWWNWGASPTKAVHDFKKRWGGQDLRFPIWCFCLGDPMPWRRQTPATLLRELPGYFVLPYDQLISDGEGHE